MSKNIEPRTLRAQYDRAIVGRRLVGGTTRNVYSRWELTNIINEEVLPQFEEGDFPDAASYISSCLAPAGVIIE